MLPRQIPNKSGKIRNPDATQILPQIHRPTLSGRKTVEHDANFADLESMRLGHSRSPVLASKWTEALSISRREVCSCKISASGQRVQPLDGHMVPARRHQANKSRLVCAPNMTRVLLLIEQEGRPLTQLIQ
jgi:hypothetical protein